MAFWRILVEELDQFSDRIKQKNTARIEEFSKKGSRPAYGAFSF